MDEQNLNYDLANIFAPQLAAQTQALQAIAMRPQKTSARTFTTSTSTPRALEDMIMRRNSIGANNQRLLDALKGRETWNYNLGAGLANLAPVQGYGDWGVNALRAFGGAMNRPTDAQIAREQAAQELAQKDLETALAFDKAMGETQTQQQVQEMGYTPMEYGTASAKGAGGQGGGTGVEDVVRMETTGGNLGDLFQTINKNPYTFAYVGGANPTEEARGLRAAVSSKGLTDLGHREFAYLNSIMPKGFSTAINTAAEQKLMRPYTTQFDTGTGSAKKASIKNMLGDIYDAYKNEALSQGLQMPISKQDYVNQRINAGRPYNAKYFIGQSDQMYETDDSGAPVQQVRESTAAEQFMRGTI